MKRPDGSWLTENLPVPPAIKDYNQYVVFSDFDKNKHANNYIVSVQSLFLLNNIFFLLFHFIL